MKIDEIRAIVANIKYKNWDLHVFENPRFCVQLGWVDKCVVTGETLGMVSRTWEFDQDPLTEDYIVNTVFKAISNAEEHETKEQFRYQGKRIFNPHVKIARLMEVCDDSV
jgi:hypothetical protein